MNARQLWQAMADGDVAARERLVTENLGLIHHTARQLRASLPADCEHDDLVSAGTLGLLEAVDSFDASRGLAFSTFAMPRIRGAMLDDLRRRDDLPRSVRRRQRDVARARQQLAGTLGREPSSRQLADAMGVDAVTLVRWESELLSGARLSLDRPAATTNEDGSAPAEAVLAAVDPTVEDQLTHEMELAAVRVALKQLTPQERQVIALYFFEELKLHEIATVMRVTESRISQIRTKALGKLRGQVGALRGLRV